MHLLLLLSCLAHTLFICLLLFTIDLYDYISYNKYQHRCNTRSSLLIMAHASGNACRLFYFIGIHFTELENQDFCLCRTWITILGRKIATTVSGLHFCYLLDKIYYVRKKDQHYRKEILHAGVELPFWALGFALYEWTTGFVTCRFEITKFGYRISTEISTIRMNCYMPDQDYYFETQDLHYRNELQELLLAGLLITTLGKGFALQNWTTELNYRICYLPDLDYSFWIRDQHYRTGLTCRTFDYHFGYKICTMGLDYKDYYRTELTCRTRLPLLETRFALQEFITRSELTCRTILAIFGLKICTTRLELQELL